MERNTFQSHFKPWLYSRQQCKMTTFTNTQDASYLVAISLVCALKKEDKRMFIKSASRPHLVCREGDTHIHMHAALHDTHEFHFAL